MNAIELLDIISTGETSKVHFKEELPHRNSVAQEIVAMSNSLGGMILIGVRDVSGEVIGLTSPQIKEYNRVISQTVDNLKPPAYLATEVVRIEEEIIKYILVIHVQEGINKPYITSKGEIYIKQGSNKRLMTDNAEIMRLFQQIGNLLADEMEIFGTSIDDVNKDVFRNTL